GGGPCRCGARPPPGYCAGGGRCACGGRRPAAGGQPRIPMAGSSRRSWNCASLIPVVLVVGNRPLTGRHPFPESPRRSDLTKRSFRSIPHNRPDSKRTHGKKPPSRPAELAHSPSPARTASTDDLEKGFLLLQLCKALIRHRS